MPNLSIKIEERLVLSNLNIGKVFGDKPSKIFRKIFRNPPWDTIAILSLSLLFTISNALKTWLATSLYDSPFKGVAKGSSLVRFHS